MRWPNKRRPSSAPVPMVINNHHHTREEQRHTTQHHTILRPARGASVNGLRLTRSRFIRLCRETRNEISSFDENEEFEIRGPPGPRAGHVHRGCRHRRGLSALSRRRTLTTGLCDRKLAPNARTATPHRRTVGTGVPAVVPRLERAKIRSGARTREPVVAGRAVRYVRVVTRLRLYRDVLERVAASKSRARRAATPRSRSRSSSLPLEGCHLSVSPRRENDVGSPRRDYRRWRRAPPKRSRPSPPPRVRSPPATPAPASSSPAPARAVLRARARRGASARTP